MRRRLTALAARERRRAASAQAPFCQRQGKQVWYGPCDALPLQRPRPAIRSPCDQMMVTSVGRGLPFVLVDPDLQVDGGAAHWSSCFSWSWTLSFKQMEKHYVRFLLGTLRAKDVTGVFEWQPCQETSALNGVSWGHRRRAASAQAPFCQRQRKTRFDWSMRRAASAKAPSCNLEPMRPDDGTSVGIGVPFVVVDPDLQVDGAAAHWSAVVPASRWRSTTLRWVDRESCGDAAGYALSRRGFVWQQPRDDPPDGVSLWGQASTRSCDVAVFEWLPLP